MEKLIGHRFIELRGKIPVDGFDNHVPYSKAKHWGDVGVVIQNPYVVIDIDDETSFQAVFKACELMAVKTRVMRSTRGGHFWFKSDRPLPNSTGISTGLSVEVDVRSYGKHSQAVVKQAGVWREWIQFDDEVDEIPFWLKPIKHDFDFLSLREGDGRNDMFFRYMITLVNSGMSRDQVRSTFNLINEFILRDRMSDNEMATITRDQAFEGIREAFFSGRTLKHDVFAQYLVNDNNIFTLNERLYMYHNGYYSDDTMNIERRMIDYISGLTNNQRRETMSYINLIAEEPLEKTPYHIITNNGMIDVRKPKELLPYNPEVFATNKINAYFDADAYDKTVDETLDKLACGDKELRLLFEEMIGYTLIPTAKFQKAFILTGVGSNGKSTFLEMLIDFLGNENVSSLSIDEFNHNFKVSGITSKLANIGDDIGANYIKESAILKKLITGEDITVDVKNESPYKLRNTATLIFAANELPKTMDKSHGMMRRLSIIPFDASFSPDDEDYNPFIIDELTSDNAHSYLLNLGIQGARRIFAQNGFTEPEIVDKKLHEFMLENNNALGFLEDHAHIIVGKSSKDIYSMYEVWCAERGSNPYTSIKFNREIRNNSGLRLETESVGGKTQQTWYSKKS